MSYANSNIDTLALTNRDADVEPNSYFNSNSDSDTNTNSNTNTNTNSNTNSNSNTYPHSDSRVCDRLGLNRRRWLICQASGCVCRDQRQWNSGGQ